MNEKVDRIIHHRATVPVSVGIVSFGAGIALGYILGRRPKKMQRHIVPKILHNYFTPEEIADLQRLDDKHINHIPEEVIVSGVQFVEKKMPGTEVVQIMDDGTTVVIEPESQEEETVAVVEPALQETGDLTPEEEAIKRTIFTENEDEWDYLIEGRNRTPSQPYVIHRDEFFAVENNYEQLTLTYYSGDDIMVDQEDVPVYNYAQVVGELKFGHGSLDPNVFYVRNDNRRAEYEILFDHGLYSVEVLGLEIENNARVRDIKHSTHMKYKKD